ncbi:UbiX family flavin prenyltransferase [Candidatus Schneideria nysicola]|uniref:UbiX family flavin prenyltransferase n=1 Tax=Candidatus Schneideria nysicola TaxID=1081631 RepID=UPI001CAA47A7|nr:UbiX family flavin prenyltransferase [Candidatus Schneideria nysicola]UAJ65077.1 UbiX family flavin prenyltransferase [Candidatus Schneideria nysicola]UAJ65610.1 UbiX family flavin prenyltransferase [Candidatus Schneideria nysicola]UAJ66138.1 UbiX family flavin prenyltransferase [Candidatus Schneideria nysicola]
MKRFIVGISGASGAIYGVRLLQVLNKLEDIEVHLILTDSGLKTLEIETSFTKSEITRLAEFVHDNNNTAANISSGSFKTIGMVIVPCSVRTLSGIVNSYSNNLLIRSADVILKEKRKLLLCVRETPLHIGHLTLMTTAAKLGAIIMPPLPAFYYKPQKLSDIINQTVNRILDQLNIDLPHDLFQRWQGAR